MMIIKTGNNRKSKFIILQVTYLLYIFYIIIYLLYVMLFNYFEVPKLFYIYLIDS